MGMTVYLLDDARQQRAAISRGISELVHQEAAGELRLEMQQGLQPRTGEHVAFRCQDGRCRIFEIYRVQELDDEGLDVIDAEDAARAELSTTIKDSAVLADMQATAALTALLDGSGWELGEVSADGAVGHIADAVFESLANGIKRVVETAGLVAVPYYHLTDGQVTAKKIDIKSAEPVYRGKILSGKNASELTLLEDTLPMGRVYAAGAWQAAGSTRTQTTIADVSWSTANGDPTDKAAGLTYIDLPGWTGAHRRAYVYTNMAQKDTQALAQEAWEDLLLQSTTKLQGMATAGDISFADGWHHSQVATDDLVGVRTKSGRAVSARVAEIRRDYIRPELTVLELGERQQQSWLTTEVEAQRSRGGRASSAISATEAVLEDMGVELYRAIEQLVTLEGDTITEFNEVWIDLNATEAEIQLLARQSQLDELSGEFEVLQSDLTLSADGLRLEIQQGSDIISQLQQTIDGLESWVTDADGNVAELVNTVRGLEATITNVNGNVGELTVTADSIVGSVSSQAGELAELRVQIDEIAAGIDDANGNTAGLTINVERIRQAVETVGGNVGELTVTADSIVGSVSTQAGELAELRTQIGEIAASIEDANGALTQLAVQAGRITGAVQDASGELRSLMEQTDERFLAVVGEIDRLGDTLESVTGSALWLDRDSITGVVGTMEERDGQLYIKEGSGLRILKNGVSYGIYDENSLTAGIIVNRINGGTVQIKASQVDLGEYATVRQMETGFSRIDDLEAGITTATLLRATQLRVSQDAEFGSLSAGTATLTGLKLSNRTAAWEELTVVEGVNLSLSKTTLPIYNASGTQVGTVSVVTNATLTTTKNNQRLLVGA